MNFVLRITNLLMVFPGNFIITSGAFARGAFQVSLGASQTPQQSRGAWPRTQRAFVVGTTLRLYWFVYHRSLRRPLRREFLCPLGRGLHFSRRKIFVTCLVIPDNKNRRNKRFACIKEPLQLCRGLSTTTEVLTSATEKDLVTPEFVFFPRQALPAGYNAWIGLWQGPTRKFAQFARRLSSFQLIN